MLPPELQSIELPVPKGAPEQYLGLRHFSPKGSAGKRR
jgi:hypothetical protein